MTACMPLIYTTLSAIIFLFQFFDYYYGLVNGNPTYVQCSVLLLDLLIYVYVL